MSYKTICQKTTLSPDTVSRHSLSGSTPLSNFNKWRLGAAIFRWSAHIYPSAFSPTPASPWPLFAPPQKVPTVVTRVPEMVPSVLRSRRTRLHQFAPICTEGGPRLGSGGVAASPKDVGLLAPVCTAWCQFAPDRSEEKRSIPDRIRTCNLRLRRPKTKSRNYQPRSELRRGARCGVTTVVTTG